MNFYINHIKITSIANLGNLNIGFNILTDNRATNIAEGVNEQTPAEAASQAQEQALIPPPPHPVSG